MRCPKAARRRARARRAGVNCGRPARCRGALRWRIRWRIRSGSRWWTWFPARWPGCCRWNARADAGARRDLPLKYAPLHLVALDALEQGLEVALAEAFVALALDDLEEDRTDRVLGEDLQQQALLRFHVGVNQDLVAREARHVLAVVRD